MWWLSKTVLESHLPSIRWFDSLIRFFDQWFDSLLRFFDSLLCFDSLFRFFDSILCLYSLFRFIASILCFDSLLRFVDSILGFDSLIRFFDSIKGPTKLKPFMKRFKLRSANPAVLPLQIFASFKTALFFWLLAKSSANFKTAYAIGGRPARLTASRFVCVSVYFFLWTEMRTLRSKLLLGKKWESKFKMRS